MAILGFTESTDDLDIFTESNLSTSESFGFFNKNNDIIKRYLSIIKNAKILTNEDIESQYMQIKQYADSFSKAAIVAFDSGILKVVYLPAPNQALTQAIPFLTMRSKDRFETYIFINLWSSTNKDGKIVINPSILNTLFRSAYAANRMKANPNKVDNNQYLQKITMEIYGKFVMRILLREYGIAPDKELTEAILYYINRFFLEIVYSSFEGENGIEILSTSHFKITDDVKYDQLKNIYNEANVTKFSQILDIIKVMSPRMNNLTLKYFMDRWISTFYPPATLAIDNFEYLIFMIISLLTGGNNIISIGAQEIVKETKNIKMFNQELLKLI